MSTDPHRGIFALCDEIRETSFAIHKYLRNEHREKIYENALANRLRKKGLDVKQQERMKVFDEDGTFLGLFKPDLLVDERLICEIKGCSTLLDEHVAQLLGYLRSSHIEHGLLINFGGAKLQIRKYILSST
jgi:GxxExxY protein